MALSLSTEKAVPLEYGDSSHEERATARNDEEVSLISSMRKRLNELPKRPNTIDGPTIFRVPTNLRKNKEHLIEPSVVSIGPYHHGRKHLAPMEDTKWLLFQEMLSNLDNKVTLDPIGSHRQFSKKKMVTLEECIEKIKSLQLQARNCYSERVQMDEDNFIKMLILDGIFIIQFVCKSYEWFQRESGWASCIRTDLIMLENQIPFFVVESLWDLYIVTPIDLAWLGVFRAKFCSPQFQSGDITIPQNGFRHLLHACHHIVVPDMSKHVMVLPECFCFDLCTCIRSGHENENKLPGATELQNAGIKFRKKKSPCKMMDVTFQGGTLEIPLIKIWDDTMPFFINLLAFEQSQVSSVPRHFSSYASFMDSIINTEHDVAILQRRGIIGNFLSGEEEVALFFNQLCQGIVQIKGHYLSDLKKKVNRYCDSDYHRNRAKLVRDYFNSPWSFISFIAAVIILGLTFVQTYFAGFDYFHPSPK